MRRVREAAKHLGIEQDMLRRGVNVGVSGGEKKRNEVLQMALLEPRLCVLDETDSGLDIDALKVVAEGVNRLRSPERAFVVITHYQRLLDHIVPDIVHVLSRGRIVRTGGKELALEARGYGQYQEEMAWPCRPQPRSGRLPRSSWRRTGSRRRAACRGRSCCARLPSSASPRQACRTGAWKSGNTPICAP